MLTMLREVWPDIAHTALECEYEAGTVWDLVEIGDTYSKSCCTKICNLTRLCQCHVHTSVVTHSTSSQNGNRHFLRQARGFLVFPLLPREASKRVPIFDRGTWSKPEMLKSGSLQADLILIV